MSQPGVLYGRTITVRTQALQGVDEYGNDVYGPTGFDVPNAVLWPTASVENTDGRDQVITTLTVLIPPGAGIVPAPTDTIVVDGDEYDIVGQPFDWRRHPYTDSRAGVEVLIRRVTG